MPTKNQQYIKERNLQIGENLRLYREAKSMSLISLAKLTGISKSQLHNYEKGAYAIPAPALENISASLGINIYILLGSKKKKTKGLISEMRAKRKLAVISLYIGSNPIKVPNAT